MKVFLTKSELISSQFFREERTEARKFASNGDGYISSTSIIIAFEKVIEFCSICTQGEERRKEKERKEATTNHEHYI